MGIVKRQTIQNMIYTYLGVGVGFVTSAIIFPKVLAAEQIGLLSILVSWSIIFAQFASLGFNATTIKIFPVFSNKEKKHHGFLFIATMVTLAGFLLALIILLFLKPALLSGGAERSPLLSEYFYYLIPLIFFTLFFRMFESYYNALFNAVIGVFAKEFLQRVLIFGMIILFFYGLVDFPTFVLLYVFSICLPTIILIIGLILQGDFHFRPSPGFIDKKMARHMLSISFFGIISGFAGIVVFNIDKIMIERFLGLGETGIYTTTFYFATLVILPSRAMLRIIGPIVSDAWNRMDLEKLSEVYFKSSIHLFIVGMLIFAGIWGNVDNIFRILPEIYSQGRWVIFFIGITFLLDMVTGGAQNIVANSEYYRYQTYFMTLLIALVIISNLLFIPQYGITGAAIASTASKLIVNFLRYLFLKKMFRLEPYNYKFLIVLAAGAGSLFLAGLLPVIDSLLLDIILRSTIILGVFSVVIILTGVAPEINQSFRQFLVSSKTRKP